MPLVAVTVIVYAPLASPLPDTFMVEEPEPTTDVGENVGFGPAGLELALNCTVPEKPPLAVIVTV